MGKPAAATVASETPTAAAARMKEYVSSLFPVLAPLPRPRSHHPLQISPTRILRANSHTCQWHVTCGRAPLSLIVRWRKCDGWGRSISPHFLLPERDLGRFVRAEGTRTTRSRCWRCAAPKRRRAMCGRASRRRQVLPSPSHHLPSAPSLLAQYPHFPHRANSLPRRFKARFSRATRGGLCG